MKRWLNVVRLLAKDPVTEKWTFKAAGERFSAKWTFKAAGERLSVKVMFNFFATQKRTWFSSSVVKWVNKRESIVICLELSKTFMVNNIWLYWRYDCFRRLSVKQSFSEDWSETLRKYRNGMNEEEEDFM